MSDLDKETSRPEEKRYLFRDLDNEYLKRRALFEKSRTSEMNRRLFDRIKGIINKSTQNTSDNIHAEKGTTVEEDTITVGIAAFKYEGLIKVGESAVDRSTDWIPNGSREINGKSLDFSVRFSSTEFVKLADNGDHQRRAGFISAEGRVTDADGVTGDFPLFSVGENPKTQQMQLLWTFGSEIPYENKDYHEVGTIIDSAEKQVGIGQSENKTI